jgi:hypothetical protein
MANKVQLKKSSVASRVPLTTDVDYGELALNYTDGKLYYKKSDGTTIDHFPSVTQTVSPFGSYANPSWITSLDSSKLTGTIDNARLNGGTYSINISGNAATVTNITRGEAAGADLNTLTTSGFYRIDSTNANRPGNWGQLLTVYGGSDTIGQLYFDYSSGAIISRAGNPTNVGGSGSWSAWKTNLNNTNFGDYLNNSYIRAIGQPSDSNDWNSIGNTYPNTVQQISANNFTSTTNGPTAASYQYGTLLNLSGQSNTQAQIYISHAGNDLIFRGGWGGTSWQTWNKVLTNQNYSSYAQPTLVSGTNIKTVNGNSLLGSGNIIVSATNADYATTAGGLNSSNYISRTGSSGNLNTDFSNTPAGTQRYQGDDGGIANSPGNYWWIYEHKRHSNASNLWGTQIAWGWEDNSNRLMQRNVTAGSWSGWVEYLNTSGRTFSGNLTMSGNITAYSDETLKKDWLELSSSFIEDLANVKSGTYTRIDSGDRQAGSSAQDWQKLLPEVTHKDEDGILSLAYGNAALVSAIELAKRVVSQESRIKRLESLIEKLI